MADTKLKPCPFCGGEAEVVANEYFADVSCKDGECRGFTDYLTFKKKSEAIEAWNRRATDG